MTERRYIAFFLIFLLVLTTYTGSINAGGSANPAPPADDVYFWPSGNYIVSSATMPVVETEGEEIVVVPNDTCTPHIQFLSVQDTVVVAAIKRCPAE